MQAYSRATLPPLRAASPVLSVSPFGRDADVALASDSAERSLDAVTAAQTLASLLIEGLSDQDVAVLARRLLPHLQERQMDRDGAHSAYTVASLAAELGVSAKAVRCAIARQELQAVKRGSRWIISADAVSEWATAPGAHHATGRRRTAQLPAAPRAAGPSLRSVLCGESPAARHGVRGGLR
jgi:excisionase family DNA binding protein